MEPLRRRADFEQVFASGKFVRGRVLALRYVERAQGTARVGYAVGKRLDSRAVVRNRARRRLREAIRQVALRQVALRDGYDIVVLARRAVLTEDFEAVRRDVSAVLERAGLLEEEGKP